MKTLTMLIGFVYTGRLEVVDSLIKEAIVAADFLLMEVALAELIQYAINNIWSMNCFDLLDIEDKLNNEHLRSLIGKQIGESNNYDDKRFLTLNCDQMLLLTKYRPEKSEPKKFLEMIARWAQAEDDGPQFVHLLLASFTIKEKVPVSVFWLSFRLMFILLSFTGGSDHEDPVSCLQDPRKPLFPRGSVGAPM